MKLPVNSLIFLVLSVCIVHIKAMSSEEANKRLFFLAIAGTSDSTIPLGSSPGSRQAHAHDRMGKSISPEGSSDDINSSQLHKKKNYALFHELFQNSMQIFGEADHHADAQTSISDILINHIEAEKKALTKKKDAPKDELEKIELEIKATRLALYMCKLIGTKEIEQ